MIRMSREPKLNSHSDDQRQKPRDRRHDNQTATNYPSSLDRRRGVGRRLSDFVRAAEEGELTQEQFLFVAAIDAFKRANGKSFPSWTEVLEVIRLLGYRKTLASEIEMPNTEDWTEKPDAPSNVRIDDSDAEEKAA